MCGQKFSATWNLEGIYAGGGVASSNIQTKLENIFSVVDDLQIKVELIEKTTDKINPAELKE